MSHAPFILAAYAVTTGGLLMYLAATWRRMHRAERRADEMETR